MFVFDVETAPLPDAADYVEPGEPPGNYKNPEAIAKWHAEDRAKQLQRAALDVDLCRVVAYATKTHANGAWVANGWMLAEASALKFLWQMVADNLPVLGFNILAFDLPVLYRRSLYLGLEPVKLQREKYRHNDVIDLADILSESGRLRLRSLDFYCRRFGIDIPAAGDGADVPGWVEAGEWDKVEAHVRVDVARTAALAKRLGVL